MMCSFAAKARSYGCDWIESVGIVFIFSVGGFSPEKNDQENLRG